MDERRLAIPCGRRDRYDVERLTQQYGWDAKRCHRPSCGTQPADCPKRGTSSPQGLRSVSMTGARRYSSGGKRLLASGRGFKNFQRLSAGSLSITSRSTFSCSGVRVGPVAKHPPPRTPANHGEQPQFVESRFGPIVLRTLHGGVGNRLGRSASRLTPHGSRHSSTPQVHVVRSTGVLVSVSQTGFKVPLHILTKATAFPRIHDQRDLISDRFQRRCERGRD